MAEGLFPCMELLPGVVNGTCVESESDCRLQFFFAMWG